MDLTTERLILKEITWNDIEDIHRLLSYPEVDEFNTMGIPENIGETKENFRAVIEAKDKALKRSYSWKVVLKTTGEFIGLAGMNRSNDKFKLGEIHYKLLPKHWGNGYATEVSKALIKAGFEAFGLHKVEAGVACENFASIKVLEKCGMTREGLRRKILPIRGEWKDNFQYAMVEDDPRDY